MGEVPVHRSGLLSKVTSLFNSNMFSDVEFLFKSDDGKIEKMYGHKLIIAIRSEYFANLFYKGKELNQLEFHASRKPSFYQLLKFLYTDNVMLKSIKETQELYEMASKYAVNELLLKCLNYLLEEQTTVENIFSKYDYALSKSNKLLYKDKEMLLEKCREFVCRETELIFKSIHEASAIVVEDIVKLDSLSVSNELDVISAVIKWGKTECERNKISADEKCLRECIFPFMKYLRFLTLSETEFQSLVEKYDIFTCIETIVLTRKIMQPESILNIPENICSITTKRLAISRIAMNNTLINANNEQAKFKECEASAFKQYESLKLRFQNLETSLLRPEDCEPSNKSKKHETILIRPKEQETSTLRNKEHEIFAVGCKEQENFVYFKPKAYETVLQKSKEREIFKSQPAVNYQVKKVTSLSDVTSTSKHFLSRTNEIIKSSNKKLFLNNVGYSRNFVFPLIECSQSDRIPYQRDIKCTVNFVMKKGNIVLHGFELKSLKAENEIQELEVDITLNGFGSKTFSDSYKKHLNNEIFTIKLPNMELMENNRGSLEVSIDDFPLSQSNICSNKDQKGEFHNGLNFHCQISLASNQKCGNDFFFLINQLLYSPC